MSLTFRPANDSDSRLLLTLTEEARKYKVSLGDLAWGDYPFTSDDIQLRINSYSCYIIEINKIPIGSVSILFEDYFNWGDIGKDNKAGYIHGLLITDRYRSKGYGKKTINWAEQVCKAKNLDYLRLDCNKNNNNLCRYYEDLGFTNSGVINQKHSESIYYQKALK